MTLDNTARLDQGSRVGKVWRSPAASKPVYICEVEVSAAGETEVALEGDFKVVDAWFAKDGNGTAGGDAVNLLAGSAGIVALMAHPVSANAVVRATALENTSVGSNATLKVQATGAATVAGSVFIAVQLHS